jgi:hypothetical protein
LLVVWESPARPIEVNASTMASPASTALTTSLQARALPLSRDAAPPLAAKAGTVIFSDDFDDPGSGWTTTPLASGTTFAYTDSGYTITAVGQLHHFANAPFGQLAARIAIALNATQATGEPPGSGFGLSCRQAALTFSPNELNRYEFLVEGQHWLIERRDGSLSTTTRPVVLKQGSLPTTNASGPSQVEAVCWTMHDPHVTRLALLVDGVKVADILNTARRSPKNGWLASIDVASSSAAPNVVTATQFAIRDQSS